MNKYLDRFNLAGRTAVVTGASEGIGRELALGLAGAGADAIVCSRREQKLIEVKAQIETLGRRGEVFVLDVGKISSIEELGNFILDRFGKVDILINNAAYTVTKPAWLVTENEWDLMLDTGLKGTFFCCQIIGAIMRNQNYGKIINLSSTFSRSMIPGRSVYAALKAGVSHLTEVLAVEWAVHGIRVNALAPTATRTPSREELLKGEVLEKVLSRIPLGRLATPDDLIGAAIYLASAASDFVTGQTLFVDGGWVAAG
ncbi:MAG: SDR family oxidoreductase [Deltaproteobacteria bacterium]|nr:SDR family oxidoreductase [Deltaproteobacteria bacterium]